MTRYLLQRSIGARVGPAYWFARRQLFFAQQRVFYILSFLLLDNARSGRLRAGLLHLNGATVGRGVNVRGNLQIQEGFGITIGDGVFINSGCLFDLSAPIVIGGGVQLAYQVALITGGHGIGPAESRAGEHRPASIHIGVGSWIGARAVILPGVRIGAGSVVAAGAVVTRDVPANTLVAGVPARVVRTLE